MIDQSAQFRPHRRAKWYDKQAKQLREHYTSVQILSYVPPFVQPETTLFINAPCFYVGEYGHRSVALRRVTIDRTHGRVIFAWESEFGPVCRTPYSLDASEDGVSSHFLDGLVEYVTWLYAEGHHHDLHLVVELSEYGDPVSLYGLRDEDIEGFGIHRATSDVFEAWPVSGLEELPKVEAELTLPIGAVTAAAEFLSVTVSAGAVKQEDLAPKAAPVTKKTTAKQAAEKKELTMTKKVTSTATARIAIPGLFTGASTFTEVPSLPIPVAPSRKKMFTVPGLATELRDIYVKPLTEDRYLVIAAGLKLTNRGYVVAQQQRRPSFLVQFIDEKDSVVFADSYQDYVETGDFVVAEGLVKADTERRLVLVFDPSGVVHHVAAYLPEEILALNLPKLGIQQPEVFTPSPAKAHKPYRPSASATHGLYLKLGLEQLVQATAQFSGMQRGVLPPPQLGDAYDQEVLTHFRGAAAPWLANIYRKLGQSSILLGKTQRCGAFAEMIFEAQEATYSITDLFAITVSGGAMAYQEAWDRGLLHPGVVKAVEALDKSEHRTFLIRIDANFQIMGVKVISDHYEFTEFMRPKGFDVPPGQCQPNDPRRDHFGPSIPPMHRSPIPPNGWPKPEESQAKFREVFDTALEYTKEASEEVKTKIFEEMLKTFRPDVAESQGADLLRSFFDRLILSVRVHNFDPDNKERKFSELLQLLIAHRDIDMSVTRHAQIAKVRTAYDSVYNQLQERDLTGADYELLFKELLASLD